LDEQLSFDALRERFAELCGRAAAVYGLNPLLGRLYGMLFLSPEPLSLDELSELVGAAKSTVSVAIRGLETYRVVRREWRKGDRRDFYSARDDFPGMLQDWYLTFFQRELRYGEQANSTAREALLRSAGSAGWPAAEQRAVLLDRLDHLDQLMAAFRAWFDQLLELASAPRSTSSEIIPIVVERAEEETDAATREAHR
jgi:DNA-binding transcriptional regulator GbsR (MarR family)